MPIQRAFIDTPEQLAAELGDAFIIFFGSAASGVANPRLPMVGQIKEQVLRLIANKGY